MILTFFFQNQIELELKKHGIDTDNQNYVFKFTIDSIETPDELPFDKIYKGFIFVSDRKTFDKYFDFVLNARENLPEQTTCELIEASC